MHRSLLLLALMVVPVAVRAQPTDPERQLRLAEQAQTLAADLAAKWIQSDNPYEVLLGLQIASGRWLNVERLVPRLVELLDDTAPRMDRECLTLYIPRRPSGMLAAGVENSRGAREYDCRTRVWPTVAAHASELLVRQESAQVVDALIKRALSHPASADNLAQYGTTRVRSELAGSLASELTVVEDAAKRNALLRLALEADGSSSVPLHLLGNEMHKGPAEQRLRAAAALLRWSRDARPDVNNARWREQATQLLSGHLSPAVLSDLARIGPAAAPLLPELRKQLSKIDGSSDALLKVLANMGREASPATAQLLGLLRRKPAPKGIHRALALVAGHTLQVREALVQAAARTEHVAPTIKALHEAKVVLTRQQMARLEQASDKLCDPATRPAGARDDFFSMWDVGPEGCQLALQLAELRGIAGLASP